MEETNELSATPVTTAPAPVEGAGAAAPAVTAPEATAPEAAAPESAAPTPSVEEIDAEIDRLASEVPAMVPEFTLDGVLYRAISFEEDITIRMRRKGLSILRTAQQKAGQFANLNNADGSTNVDRWVDLLDAMAEESLDAEMTALLYRTEGEDRYRDETFAAKAEAMLDAPAHVIEAAVLNFFALSPRLTRSAFRTFSAR
jgi:hypothetical protein